ncbi:hypothetical protein DPMN_056575 [Dreissena polymorpha]|uniref:Uncharacterized protein n=1 Tax=Dreissena polymorpha TaxID=45954 RepID=A0A9D4HTQ9_DREPO|nr:hypothetical protein DPMN_056575 [Dreissena polymorpha]
MVGGGEYEISGVDADDTGGPSSWGFSIEDLVVAQDEGRNLEIFLQWKRRRRRMLMRGRYSQLKRRRLNII